MPISFSPQTTAFEDDVLHQDRLDLSTRKHRVRNWLLVSAFFLLGILVAGFVLVMLNWPFTRAQVEKDLAEATASTVTIESFQPTYFPRPGCMANGVTFRRSQDSRVPALITVQKLTIQGSFVGLLTKHVPVIRAEGAHVTHAAL